MKFIYLNLKDHPRGNIILQELINHNLKPLAVIEEKSSLATKNHEGILSAFEGSSKTFPTTQNIVSQHNIPLFEVENHNNFECEKILHQYGDLDLIILGDTRIIKNNILSLPKIGIINSHPGYLPDVRGNNPYIWAIINNLPQGCSVHFIDENVDTGDVILRERIDLNECKSYIALLEKINNICSRLIVEAVLLIRDNKIIRTPQSNLTFVSNNIYNGKEFLAASKEIKKQAIEELRNIN